MESTLLIIVAFIAVLIGYFAGSILAGRRAERNPRLRLPEGSLPAQANPAAPAARIPAVDKNRSEVVALWRELPSGALNADFDGQTVHSAEEITPEQRRRLIQMVKDLRPWLMLQSSPIAMPPSPTVVSTTPAAPAPAEAVIPVSQPITAPLAPRAPLPAVPPSSPPVTLPKGPISPVPPTIAKQIDDILQESVEGTPLYERGLSLVELPNHEVQFKVGLVQYDSIDKIPDPEIVAAFRAAIKQWEKNAG